MAVTITSFTPTTAYTTGGTSITVTGTNLDTVTAALVDNHDAVIVGTPIGTTLVLSVPAGLTVGAKKITLFDGSAYVISSGNLTLSASPSTDTIASAANKTWRLDVNTGSHGSPTWVKVRGITSFKPGVSFSTADDSDYDSAFWGSDTKTSGKWQTDITLKRGNTVDGGAYDPGQEVIRAAHDQTGTAGTVEVRWYVRSGNPEAYQGYAQVTWDEQGGDQSAFRSVNVQLLGQGVRNSITNPVIADPTLATS